MTHGTEEEFDEDTGERLASPPAFYTVAIFMVDLADGGPEEGGWHYMCGVPIDHVPHGIDAGDLARVFAPDKKMDARDWLNDLQDKLNAGPNVGRREISSVLSDGRYEARLCDGWPKPFPATIPHYE